MTRQPPSPLLALLSLALFATVTAVPAGAQTPNPRVAQLEAALAANSGHPALQRCLQSDSDVDYFQVAVTAIERSRDPNVPGKFYCGWIGANWQEVPSGTCCATFERDKGRDAGAWIALQQCGWRAEVEKRRPAYLQAADKCLAAAGAAVAVSPQPPARGGEPNDAWRDVPTFDRVKPQILGQDACAITSGPAWSVFDNAGRQRGLPGFLADRVQRGFALLDDRAWLQTAVASIRSGLSVDETILQMLQGGPDSAKQFIWFGDTFVRHYLPNASLAIPVGRDVDLTPAATTPPTQAQIQRISSEHGSVRGTCNGGGDFIRFEPNGPNRDVWQPRIIRAAWQRAAPSLPEPNVRLELPTAVVTADGGAARVVVDLAPNGAAAILVVSGQVQVRENTTGQSRSVSRGDAALVWPGIGVSQPVQVNADRFAAASRPRIRGSIVMQPGQEWSGPLQLDGGILPIEARLLYEKPAGANYVLEVLVNGRPITDAVLNKMSPMRYADGRNFPYREPNSAKWMLFYSADYAANNGQAGGGYEVKTDPGQAYRYIWNVASLAGGNAVAQVQFRNSSNPPNPLELRLLPSEPLNRYTATSPPPTTQPPPTPTPSKPKGGLFGGLVDALKDVAKGVAKPSTTTGVTPPAYPPPDTSPVPYGSPSVQGQPHLAVYTVSTLLGHGDFNYPLVVQLQDGSGQPMYPAAPLTVTVTSSDPRVVTVYGADRRPTATLTLRPPVPSSVGMSWDSVSIIAASASVAGTATLTATAPGLPGASVTVTVVPTRTPDNRGTPAQTAPGARVRLTVLPPITETDRAPLASVELLDAQGQPTGVDFGPGDWTLESSNPAVRESYAASFRYGQMGYPRAPGQTQLTVISKRRGVTGGSSATLTAIAPGTATTRLGAPEPPVAVAPSVAVPVPAPAPAGTTGRVVPRGDFGEAAVTGRISNIVTARDVRNGVAIDITDAFGPDVNPLHVWFRLAGFAPGTLLTSRWTYLGGTAPMVIGTGEFTTSPAGDYGTFSYELAAGKRWPVGDYRIEILLDGSVVGSAGFMVAGARN